MPDFQVLFNIAMVIAGFFGGFLLNAIWQKIDRLEMTDKSLVEHINTLNISVATQGAHRTEDSKKLDAIFEKLDRIDVKLDRKVDKQGA